MGKKKVYFRSKDGSPLTNEQGAIDESELGSKYITSKVKAPDPKRGVLPDGIIAGARECARCKCLAGRLLSDPDGDGKDLYCPDCLREMKK